jgi:hypothetical protein
MLLFVLNCSILELRLHVSDKCSRFPVYIVNQSIQYYLGRFSGCILVHIALGYGLGDRGFESR